MTKSSDGQVLRVTGTGVIPEFYHHAGLAGGGTEQKVYIGQDGGPRWVSTERDIAGRTVKVSKPAFGGQIAVTEYAYGNGLAGGQPVLITSSDQPAEIRGYNAVNELESTGRSGDGTTLEPNSATDRISETQRSVVSDAAGLWLVEASIVYPTAGSGTPKTVQTTRRLVAGFTGAQSAVSESIDLAGNTTRSVTETDRAARTQTQRSIRPGSSDEAVSVAYAGRTVSMHTPGSSGSVSLAYDALGRTETVKQPGHAQAESTTYHPGTNQVKTRTDAHGAATHFTYVPQGQPGAGQVKTVTDADSGVVTHLYDLLGRTVRTSGARTYPVAYGYDDYGQMEKLTTWQDYAGQGGAAETRWEFEPATGLLLNKKDAELRATGYTYDLAGRLLTRTWARSVGGQPLMTTYGYDPVMRDLTGVDYSDVTPDVAFAYDRLGRQTSASTAAGVSCAYGFNSATLLPETETTSYDLDGDSTAEFVRTITRQHDGLRRSGGFTLHEGANPAELSATYEYEAAASRLDRVVGRLPTDPLTFQYAYLAARPGLPWTVTGPAHTVTNTYEANRDVLDSKSNAPLTGPALSAYDYLVNPIGQRTEVAATGTAFAAATGWGWQYDALGQVDRATHVTNTAFHRTYLYDDIGNRKASSQGPPPGLTTAYTPNLLNQYTAITGNNAPPVAPSHDFDGNQLGGASGPAGGMTFEWDGENRLRQVKDAGNNVVVTYTYDAHSRRVAKTTGTARTHALYDGWNLLAEYQASLPGTGAPVLQRSYLWGSDLSGGLQGAGGVGGLLAARLHTGANEGVYYPTYDGNGNVSEYFNATGGVAAHYEYGPFGESLIPPTGVGLELPFRFSTKYQDAETGLYSYIFRPYDPITGRWLSRDPIEEKGGINLYGFVANASISFIDPLGNGKFDWQQFFNDIIEGNAGQVGEAKKYGEGSMKIHAAIACI